MTEEEVKIELLKNNFTIMEGRMEKLERGVEDLEITVNQRFDKFEEILQNNTNERRTDICKLHNRIIDNEKALIEMKQQYKPIGRSYNAVIGKLIEMIAVGIFVAAAYSLGLKQ